MPPPAPARVAAPVHELSIAVELVELAAAEARRQGAGRVVALHLRIGPLAGIVEDALRFSFDVAAAGTAVAGARLRIEPEEVVAWCPACAAPRPLPTIRLRRCPVCDAPTPDLVTGDALELTALEISDDDRPDR